MDTSEEVNEESDADLGVAFHTRSKRRKLNDNEEECTSVSPNPERRRKNPIAYMPVEILQIIFGFVSCNDLSQSVRLVNHRFRIIAEDILNSSFRYIQKKLQNLILTTEISLAFTQDDMEIKCISKLLNFLEILQLHYDVVISTIWRYVYNRFYKTTNGCMYAGELIDAYLNFIDKFVHCPNILYSPAVIRDYNLPQEVTKIIHMTKHFCVYFDKVTEDPLRDCLIYTGCKILDIIDCAKYAQKIVLSEKVRQNYFVAEYTYYFRNSWFVAIPIIGTKNLGWSHRQRMMQMRLRRIVFAHNEMFLQQDHYDRDFMIRPEPVTNRLRRPGNNVYTGYGDVGNLFFYYGVMNEGAYLQRFGEENDEESSDEDMVDENNNNADIEDNNSSNENILYRIPYLGMRMNIKVKCPLSYAPLKYLNRFSCSEQCCKDKTQGSTHINIVFECEGASYPRLPTSFEYEFSPKK